jgi:hypothetical protein
MDARLNGPGRVHFENPQLKKFYFPLKLAYMAAPQPGKKALEWYVAQWVPIDGQGREP